MGPGTLALRDVTLACVDTAHPALALRALARSCSHIDFGRVLLLTDSRPAGIDVASNVEIADSGPIRSRDEYSQFVLKRLVAHIGTPLVLLVQWDGYVVNPEAWDPSFANVDYLGARWFWHDDGHDVGNGGFSLRSKRLLDALQDPRIHLIEAEDTTIGRSFRALLEHEHGIRFGDARLADRFAFEAAYPVGKPFGFHGLYNFCRIMPPAELAALVPLFTPAILRSQQLAQLLRNCVAMGQWSPAIAIARAIRALTPDHLEARLLLERSEAALARGEGISRNDPCPCGSGKRFKQCHGTVRAPAPIQQEASAIDATLMRAIESHPRGNLDDAERQYRGLLALSPEHPHALHYLGVIAYQRGHGEEALPLLRRAVELVSHEPEFYNNLGLALTFLDRIAEAVEAFRSALALRPDHAGVWNNLGLALHARNDVRGAIEAFKRALGIAPDSPQTRWNLALALLHDGRFREGWEAYEVRLRIPAFAGTAWPLTPRWDGAHARGKKILLVAEQGLGDAIQFVRFAAELARRGARVIAKVPPPLMPLMSRVEGVDAVVSSQEDPPPHDAWLPLLSLGRVLDVDTNALPGCMPYLRADAVLQAEASRALHGYSDTLTIGVAWAGNRANSNDRRRSIPLAQFATFLFHIAGVTPVSLQCVDEEDSGGHAGGTERLVRLGLRNSIEGIAALGAAVDLVVTVDTSIAHVAGGMGRPVFILLPFASDWRWRLDRSDSDWYPSATLFRQSAPGDWSRALHDVREAIHAFARLRPDGR